MRGLQLGAALLLGVAAGGCRTSAAAQPLAPEMAGAEPEAQMELWHALPERRVASNDEAFHSLLLFLDGQDGSPIATRAWARCAAARCSGWL